MAWSDILGTIGAAAGAIGGLVPGPVGGLIGDIGNIANLGGSLAATQGASGQARQAQQATGQATQTALALGQQQAQQESQTFSKAMGLIPQEMTAYNKMLATLGPMAAPPQFDENTVITRANQLLPQYMQEADYTMQNMFSKDIGGLMKSGMDDSTYGVASRAALGAKSADVHQQMYNQAYTDALNYATGIYGQTMKGYDATAAARAAALKEAIDPYSAAIGDYSGLFGKTGSASSSLNVAGNLADQLSKAAAAGTAAAATGAAGSTATSGVKDLLSNIKDIWGGNLFGGNSTTPTPSPYVGGLGAGTTATGADY